MAILRDFRTFDVIGKRIAADPMKTEYTDTALAPVTEADDETLKLLTHDDVARAAVQHYRSVQRLTAAAPVP